MGLRDRAMNAYIEHANLYVSNLDEAFRFLTTALPEFVIRGRGTNEGIKWLHIGTDSSYLALSEAADERRGKATKLNHIGFVVDDVASIKARLLEAGYQEGSITESHKHRKRLYFLDSDGLEWEFVQYLSDILAERNDYAR
jgi:catechol 2,3-dioxygenase-like lactoylglutathione lyase family enzyme